MSQHPSSHHNGKINDYGTIAVDLPANSASTEDLVPTNPATKHFWFKCLNTSTMSRITQFAAELIGTALLLFFGCMGSLTWHEPNNNFQASVTFGIVVMFSIQCFGPISGGHFNPAVTVSAYLQRKIGVRMSCAYFAAQFLGAFIGVGLLKQVTPADVFRPDAGRPGTCTTQPQADLSAAQAFAIEYCATMVLITMICGAWDERNVRWQDSMPLKFGFALASLSIATGPATGCSLNPTRSLAPAIWNNDWRMHWIYWAAPLSSAIITTLLYQAIFADVPPKPREANSQ